MDGFRNLARTSLPKASSSIQPSGSIISKSAASSTARDFVRCARGSDTEELRVSAVPMGVAALLAVPGSAPGLSTRCFFRAEPELMVVTLSSATRSVRRALIVCAPGA